MSCSNHLEAVIGIRIDKDLLKPAPDPEPPYRKCSTHGVVSGKFCPDCGTPTILVTPEPPPRNQFRDRLLAHMKLDTKGFTTDAGAFSDATDSANDGATGVWRIGDSDTYHGDRGLYVVGCVLKLPWGTNLLSVPVARLASLSVTAESFARSMGVVGGQVELIVLSYCSC